MVGVLLFIILVYTGVFSYSKNKDLLSPSKFYLFYIALYFAAIFYKEYSVNIYFTYLSLLIIGMILLVFEPNMIKYKIDTIELKRSANKNIKISSFYNIIWILSIVPIISQRYMINYMGGFQRYVNRIGFRVIEWQGMGLILESIKLFSILNIIYFALILLDDNHTKKDWFKYILHLVIMLIIGLLSGSRGGLLGNFVIMTIVYNYFKKRVTLRKILPIIISLLFIASVMGVARNGYKITSEGFVSGISNTTGSIMSFKHFEYGLNPLELIYSQDISELQYGLTFITPITNLVPRMIWPGKPDTGGLIFTKLYTGDAWGGYSNLAPGIIGEGVINFGKPLGIIFGLALFVISMIVTIYLYKNMLESISRELELKSVFLLIFYAFSVSTVPGLVQAEWTNTILGLMLRAIKLFILYIILKYSSRIGTSKVKNRRTKRIVFAKSRIRSAKQN